MPGTVGDMPVLFVVGRVLFALIFLIAAPRHFTAEAAAHATALGVPLARIAVPLSGLLAIAGGLSVATGYRVPWGAFALIAFLVPVTVMMHAFWRLDDPAQLAIQRAHFVKNVALIGACLMLAARG